MNYNELIVGEELKVPEQFLKYLGMQLRARAEKGSVDRSPGVEPAGIYFKKYIKQHLQSKDNSLFLSDFPRSYKSIDRALKGTMKNYELLDALCYAAFDISLFDYFFVEKKVTRFEGGYDVKIPYYVIDKFKVFKENPSHFDKKDTLETKAHKPVEPTSEDEKDVSDFDEQVKKYLHSLSEKYSKIFIPSLDKSETEIDIEDIIHLGIIDARLKKPAKENDESEKENLVKENELKNDSKNDALNTEENPKPKLPRSEFAVINIIDELDKVLIEAEGGAGKTTLAKWIAYHHAKKILSGDETYLIPIFIELKHYRGNLLSFIMNSMEESEWKLSVKELKQLIKDKKCILILDALDELQENKYFGEILNESEKLINGNKIVLTSRKIPEIRQFQKNGFEKFKLKKLSETEIEELLEKHMSFSDANHLLYQMREKEMMDTLSSPLLLTFVISKFKKHGTTVVFKTRGLLLKSAINEFYFETWDWDTPDDIDVKQHEITYEDFIAAICRVAYKMTTVQTLFLKENIVLEIIGDHFKLTKSRNDYGKLAAYVLRRVLESNLFVKSKDEVGFSLKSYRDYFTAEYFFEKYSLGENNKKIAKYFKSHFSNRNYEESLVIFTGLIDKPELLIKQMLPKQAYYWFNYRKNKYVSLNTITKCIGSSKVMSPQLTHEVIESINTLIEINKWDKGQNGFFNSLRNLFYWLCNGFGARLGDYYLFLAHTKSIEALKIVVPRITKDDGVYEALNALKLFPITAGFLEQARQVWHEKSMREEFFIHLRVNYSINSVNYFLQLIESENLQDKKDAMNFFNELRYKGVHERLEKWGVFKKIISSVIACYLNNTEEILSDMCKKFYSHYSLIHDNPIFDYACNILIESLSSEKPHIRHNALLGMPHYVNDIREVKIVKAIIAILDKETEEFVKKMAIEALSWRTLNGSSLKEEIRNAIYCYITWDTDTIYRGSAAIILGKIRDEAQLENLKTIARHDNYYYSKARAIAAVLKMEPEFINEMKDLKVEEQYLKTLNMNEINSTKYRIIDISNFGTEITKEFLHQFKEKNKTHKSFKQIAEIYEMVERDIERNIKKYGIQATEN